MRADPELLHWQAVPSPVHPETPGLPSPRYEEVVVLAAGDALPSPRYEEVAFSGVEGGLPSYDGREGMVRRKELLREGGPDLTTEAPEIVEGRGIGFA